MPNRESARNGVALLAACSQAARYGHVPEVGCTGGLFTPTMNFGALLGGYLGQGWSFLAPGTSKDIYARLGAGVKLASASQGPLSSVVFMLELTNHPDASIVPLLIAAAGATLMARKLDVHSICSIRG